MERTVNADRHLVSALASGLREVNRIIVEHTGNQFTIA